MKISRFEDIEAWRSARKLMNLVYDMTNSQRFNEDRDLKRQMRNAATSSMANIAEGFDAGSDPEFQRFLALGDRGAIAPSRCRRPQLHRPARVRRRLRSGPRDPAHHWRLHQVSAIAAVQLDQGLRTKD